MPEGTDIFKSFDFVNELQKKYYESEDETTLMIGTYGAQTEIAASLLQRSLIVAAENSGEAIPTRAKYEKNIIAHARFVGINDIYATPARMSITLMLPKKQIDSNLKQNKFVVDKECPFMIGEYEFHLDYDIIITRTRLRTNEYVYTAIYDMNVINVLSDLESPNLPPVGIFTVDTMNGELLSVMCQVRQVSHSIKYERIMTDNSIENKTLTFEYTDQLACFDVDVTEGDDVYHLTPVYDGTINTSKDKYCEYQDIDSSTIRIKFNRDSYLPRINADVAINIKTTKGFGGVFPYKDDVLIDLKSTIYGYSGLNALLRPSSDSYQGIDRKTVDELKAIMPKEALSRGSIINTIDLESFFNSTNLENSKLYFYKKKYNQLDHIYYSYLLMKYNDTIVPTNTVDIKVSTADIDTNGKNWYIKPLSHFKYSDGWGNAVLATDEKATGATFDYVTPFMIAINKNPLVVSYYLTSFKINKFLNFDYINQASSIQFVSTGMTVLRSAFSDTDSYKISIPMMQNITSDFGLVTENEDGTLTTLVKVFLLLYNENDTSVWRYVEADLTSFERTGYTYQFDLELNTDNVVSDTNLLKITNLRQPVTGTVVDSYVGNGVRADILIMANTSTFYGNEGYSDILPDTKGYSLCNKYGVRDGIELFYNYTQMMSSTPIVTEGAEGNYTFTVDKVPMIRKSYITDEYRMWSLINEIQTRRKYIEYSLGILEDGFDIDFKFFNTYGPSRRFTLNGETLIDRVNLSIKFRTKLYSNAEKYLIDIIKDEIKTTIEDIGNISDIHMTNIAEGIRTKYKDQLEFFEFINFNEYGPGETHIYQVQEEVKHDVPEFLNINTSEDGTPDIEILDK